MSTAIIDADSYIYRAALTCKELVEIQEGVYYEAYNINLAKDYLNKTAETLTQTVGCTEYIFVVGGVGKNFRLALNPSYKGNRKKQAKPIMLDKVRDMAFNEFPMVYFRSLEADDTCRILLEGNKDNVLISIDKDLKTVSGKIYDSYHDKMRFISPQQAQANFKRQLLMGDKCDGYDGIPGVGKATADKLLLDGIDMDGIVQMYLDKGLTLEDFKNTYNCAKILGKDDYDVATGTISLYGGETIKVGDLQ